MRERSDTVGITVISKGMQWAMFATAMAWTAAASAIASRAAQGITVRFRLEAASSLLEGAFLLFLVVVGFRMLDAIATRGRFEAQVLPLPRRSGWVVEWGVGASIGWGLCLAAVLPVLLTGNLHGRLHWQQGSAPAILMGLATLLMAALAEEAIFRGYPFRRLSGALGQGWATVLLSTAFGLVLVQGNSPSHLLLGVIDGTLFGILLTIAWMRTHALWLGWGLHFAYRAIAAVVLGLPIVGRSDFGSLSDTFMSGPRWLTGGAFGLDAALLTALVMLAGVAVLYRATREYAWQFTHAPIVAGGYEVVVAPPAAHVAMEKAAAPPPLVQILPVTSQTRSSVEWPEGNSVDR